MAFQVVAAVEAELIWLSAGEKIENTLWFVAEDMGVGALEALADELLVTVSENILPQVSENVTLERIVCTFKGADTGPQFVLVPDVSTPGLKASAVMPNNVTCAIKFGTASIGRSFRGRNFVVGLTENEIVASALESATASAYVAAYEQVAADCLAIGFTHVVVSRRASGAPREEGITTPVTYYAFTDLSVDSQRCRLPGHRRKHAGG